MNQKVRTVRWISSHLCVVCGVPKKKTDILTGYLEKKSERTACISRIKTPESRSIRTKYTVLETRRDFSLLEVELLYRSHAPDPRATWRPSAARLRATANTAKRAEQKRRASRIQGALFL